MTTDQQREALAIARQAMELNHRWHNTHGEDYDGSALEEANLKAIDLLDRALRTPEAQSAPAVPQEPTKAQEEAAMQWLRDHFQGYNLQFVTIADLRRLCRAILAAAPADAREKGQR